MALDTDSTTDWVRNDFDLAGIPGYPGSITLGEAYNTPGAPNQAYAPPPEACGDAFTPIYTVQGDGAASPLVGMEVAVEGVVVGDFQNNGSPDNGDLNGFHVQDPVGDGNPATSDGIFVYAPGGMDVSTGDSVRVRGSVSEFNGMTEITASQIWSLLRRQQRGADRTLLARDERRRFRSLRRHAGHLPPGPGHLRILQLRPLRRDRPDL